MTVGTAPTLFGGLCTGWANACFGIGSGSSIRDTEYVIRGPYPKSNIPPLHGYCRNHTVASHRHIITVTLSLSHCHCHRHRPQSPCHHVTVTPSPPPSPSPLSLQSPLLQPVAVSIRCIRYAGSRSQEHNF